MRQNHDSVSAGSGLALFALLSLLMVAPAAYASGSKCEARAAHLDESIPVEMLDSWEPVDERTLLIWTSHDIRAHLVRLQHAVPGLVDATTIFLVTGSHEHAVDACGRDAVMVQGSGRARIASIRYLSTQQTAEFDAGASTAIAVRMTST